MIRTAFSPRWILTLALFALTACGGGDSGDEEPNGDELPGAGEVGEQPGDMPGAIPGLNDPEDPVEEDPEDPVDDPEDPIEDPEDPVEEPPMHSGRCTQTQFTAVEELAYYEDFGPGYIGIDGPLDQPYGLLFVQTKTVQGGPAEPGIYDLKDSTDLSTCKTCVYSMDQCNPQTRRCARLYVAAEGALEIYATGMVDEPFRGRLINVEMRRAVSAEGTGATTFVEGGDDWCAHDVQFDMVLDARPAELGDTVRDFELQSCATDEMVSVKSIADQTNALWVIAAAGWCSACRQHIPNVLSNAANIPSDRMTPIFVVGENSNYGQPTTAFCRQYAATYGVNDPVNWFIDHDGQGGFATTFHYLWPYLGAGGEFGLPWNAVVRGSDFTYVYSDGSGQGDLGTVLNQLIGQ